MVGHQSRREAQGTFGLATGPRQSELPLGSLSLSNPSAAQYGDEMDWTPTSSQHRAFATQGQQQTQGSGATDRARGHFWHPVPPAPTTPAQRLFNPPSRPRQRNTQAVKRENPFLSSSGSGPHSFSQPQDEKFKLAEPTFFSAPSQNDPRNSLSDLFGESFSLSQEERAEQAEAARILKEKEGRQGSKGWFGGGSWFGSGK